MQEWDDLGFGLTTKDTQMVARASSLPFVTNVAPEVASCPMDGEWNSFKAQTGLEMAQRALDIEDFGAGEAVWASFAGALGGVLLSSLPISPRPRC